MANQKPKACPFNPYKHKGHFARHLVTTVFLVVITFLAGLYLAGTGTFSPFGTIVVMEKTNGVTQTIVKKGSYETGYNEALDFARQKLAEKGEFELPTNLTVVVKSASGQNVVVEFDASLLDPFAEGMATRTIVVGGETNLYERVQKDEEQFKKEYAEYEKAMKVYETALAGAKSEEGLEEPNEPREYEEKVLVVSDLLPGDRVRIRAKMVEVEGGEEGEENKDAEIVSPFASDNVDVVEIRLYSRPEPKLEKELPEELLEAAPEVTEEIEEPAEEATL